MRWTITTAQPFDGQTWADVVSRDGTEGFARIEYHPICRVVGPVVRLVGGYIGYAGDPDHVLDECPMFVNIDTGGGIP